MRSPFKEYFKKFCFDCEYYPEECNPLMVNPLDFDTIFKCAVVRHCLEEAKECGGMSDGKKR